MEHQVESRTTNQSQVSTVRYIMTDAYLEVQCVSAADLLRQLTPQREAGPIEFLQPYQWAFRGQSNADWQLIPCALRPGTLLGYYQDQRHFVSEGKGGCPNQCNGELVAVRQFITLADRIGLPIPGMHPMFRQDSLDFTKYDTIQVGSSIPIGADDWPLSDTLEILAIAQHHGVPTRLLDFSYSAMAAAFFAAEEAARSPSGSDFAVWAVDLVSLHNHPGYFEIVEVVRANNSFLHAQRGLFLLYRLRVRSSLVTPPMDEVIRQICDRNCRKPAIVKFCLRSEFAGETLDLLAKQGIDRAHLMPTYDNVVQLLRRIQNR